LFSLQIKEFLQNIKAGNRLLGVDLGGRKIGIALSDILQTIATPMQVLIRNNYKKDIGSIINIIKEHSVSGVVIGLPIMPDGREGDACIIVRNFAKSITEQHDLPVYFQDERMSTSAAKRMLNETNLTRKKKDQIDDKIAACIILQTTLDQLNMQKRYEQ
jgi:putative Holliday junction resolvase